MDGWKRQDQYSTDGNGGNGQSLEVVGFFLLLQHKAVQNTYEAPPLPGIFCLDSGDIFSTPSKSHDVAMKNVSCTTFAPVRVLQP
jgi:hypothetical protein